MDVLWQDSEKWAYGQKDLDGEVVGLLIVRHRYRKNQEVQNHFVEQDPQGQNLFTAYL